MTKGCLVINDRELKVMPLVCCVSLTWIQLLIYFIDVIYQHQGHTLPPRCIRHLIPYHKVLP